jgi:hypothetical protein
VAGRLPGLVTLYGKLVLDGAGVLWLASGTTNFKSFVAYGLDAGSSNMLWNATASSFVGLGV